MVRPGRRRRCPRGGSAGRGRAAPARRVRNWTRQSRSSHSGGTTAAPRSGRGRVRPRRAPRLKLRRAGNELQDCASGSDPTRQVDEDRYLPGLHLCWRAGRAWWSCRGPPVPRARCAGSGASAARMSFTVKTSAVSAPLASSLCARSAIIGPLTRAARLAAISAAAALIRATSSASVGLGRNIQVQEVPAERHSVPATSAT